MNQDIKIIKKKYGENMSKLCRESFPTLLEKEELLLGLLMSSFDPSHTLYDDIISEGIEDKFRNYIYSMVDNDDLKEIKTDKTPKELMNEAGYDLYECTTEAEIQSFKKYYSSGEELCTFRGNRLKTCRVFFAVKKNVEKIKREDFNNPERQDAYGTSVISIQFFKDECHMLSIKNRYNHTVKYPDSTFSNNLDSIIPGLTYAFETEYGLHQEFKNSDFELDGYVRANDGKYYKYNYEINNIYYCSNNVIIDKTTPQKFEKELYLILDYFILDLQNKKILLYDQMITDSFVESVGEIQKINILNVGENKEIEIVPIVGEPIIITCNKLNQIIQLKNNNVEKINDGFLHLNSTLQKFEASNLEEIGNQSLLANESLEDIMIPKVRVIGTQFLYQNNTLKILYGPSVKKIGDNCLANNNSLLELNLPVVEEIGNAFLLNNQTLKKLVFLKLKKIGNYFMGHNCELEEIWIPMAEEIGNYFLTMNQNLKEIAAPNLKYVGLSFLKSVQLLTELELLELEKVGSNFLGENPTLEKLIAPKLQSIAPYFLFKNNVLQVLDAPIQVDVLENPYFAINPYIRNLILRRDYDKTSHR